MRTLTIALSAVCVAALAVTVPQASIDDYFFSRPNCTNLTGTVIGEPPAYTTLRREDIAWLREAAAERAALQSRSWNGLPISIKTVPNKIGSFPLSSSNTFSRYVTAKEWVSGSLQTNIVTTQIGCRRRRRLKARTCHGTPTSLQTSPRLTRPIIGATTAIPTTPRNA